MANMGQNDSEKELSEQIETREPVVKPRKQRNAFVRHCARFWWIHVIIFCIVFLIIALCLVYVGMPKIAQHGVNESHLEFTKMEFLQPTDSNIVLTQDAILHSPSMYTPTLDSFSAATYLVTNGTYGAAPIIYIQMPSIHALHPTSNASVDSQKVAINDMTQLTDYATAVLKNEYVTTALVGKTKLHEGALPVVTVNYNSSSTYKGLNSLKGFNTTGVKINLLAATGQPNLSGFAFIPNPSIMTIEMGNVTLSLAIANVGVVGTATINDFTLVPGNNSLPMTGTMNQTLVAKNLDSKGFVTLLITGESAVYNGVHLPYYESALQSNVLSLSMNVLQIISDSSKPS